MRYSKQSIRTFILFSVLFSISFTTVVAQTEKTGAIKGSVTTSDGQPATDVSVILKNNSKTIAATIAAVTTQKGIFEFRKIKPGNYTLRISFVGYETMEQEVVITENKIAKLDLQLKLSDKQLQEVTITGSSKKYTAEKPSQSLRLNQELIEVPQNIAVTTQQTFKDIGAVSSADIMRTVAGVMATGSKQDIGINIRGTSTSYSILRNGIGAGYWYNMELDPAMIERAEFIKGPAGYMVSNTEPGGLANFVTKQPTHEHIAAANFGFGSWDMMRTTIDLGGEFKKDGALTYRFNAGYQQQNQFYDFGYLKKYFVAAALKYELDKNTEFTFEYNYVHGHQLADGQTLQTVGGKQVLPINYAVTDPNTNGTVSSDQYFRFHAKHKLSDNWTLNAQAAYVAGPWGGYNMGLAYVPVSNDTLYRQTWYTNWQNKLFTAQAFLDGTFHTGNIEHKVLVGIDYGDNHTSSGGGGDYSNNPNLALNLAGNPVYYLPGDSLKNFDTHQFLSIWGNHYSALYVQYNAKFFEKLIVTLAGRYTSNTTVANYSDPNIVKDKRFTPRLGLTYLFTKNISVYGLYDQAFIPQSGRSFTGQVFTPLVGNDKELGIKSFWLNKKLSANLSVYKITKNNALTTDPLHNGFQVQTGQLVSKGVELDINGSVTRNLNILANYAYTDARITKAHDSTQVGLPNYGSAKNITNVFAKYRFTDGMMRGFAIGAGVQYVGDRTYASDVAKVKTQVMPAYTLLEATVGYTLRKFYVNLNAYNLANKKYITSAYALGDIDYEYQPGEPINFRIDFGINF